MRGGEVVFHLRPLLKSGWHSALGKAGSLCQGVHMTQRYCYRYIYLYSNIFQCVLVLFDLMSILYSGPGF